MSQPPPRIKILLPPRLRILAGGNRTIEVNAPTIDTALHALFDIYPALRPHLLDQNGSLLSSVLFFLNAQDIRSQQAERTRLSDGDVLSIVPQAEGG